MAVAVLGIYQGQASAVRATLRAQYRAQATALAQDKMTEIEIIAKKKGFLAIPAEEKGEFKDDKLKRFTWVRTLEKVDLGCFIPQQSKDEQSGFFALAARIFEQAVRKIKVEVMWTEGKNVRREILSQLYVRFEDLSI